MRIAALLLAIALACPAAAGPADLLPDDGFLPGWVRAGEAREYRGAELYGHINGGSEIFLEYGFDHLHIQHFHDNEGQVVMAEIYVMDDPTAALGIYLTRINGREQPNPGILQRHSTNPLQVLVVVDRYFVVTTIPSGQASLRPVITEIARQTAKAAPQDPLPDPFSQLPAEGRVHLSERVVAGPFTLSEIVTLGPGDILQLGEASTAVAADYAVEGDEPTTLIRVTHPSAAAAAAAFGHLAVNLDSYIERLEVTDQRLVFKDYKGRFGDAVVVENRVEIRLNLAAQP